MWTSLLILKIVANSIHVDEIIFTSTSTSLLQFLIYKLHFGFSLKQLSDLEYFLDIGVKYLSFFYQTKYVCDMLNKVM